LCIVEVRLRRRCGRFLWCVALLRSPHRSLPWTRTPGWWPVRGRWSRRQPRSACTRAPLSAAAAASASSTASEHHKRAVAAVCARVRPSVRTSERSTAIERVLVSERCDDVPDATRVLHTAVSGYLLYDVATVCTLNWVIASYWVPLPLRDGGGKKVHPPADRTRVKADVHAREVSVAA